jgi:L-amino acid N-acyltransferase YncA
MIAASGAPPVILRDAADADFARIAEIYGHHVRTGFGTFDETAPDAAEIRERFGQIARRGLPYLVAAGNGIILGYAYAAPYRPRSAYRFTVEDSIYVAPEAQRRGIATALLEAVIARCAAAGMRQLVAVIGDSDNAASIGLHAKLGFRRVGVLRDVGFKAGRSVDTVIMQRAL